LEDFVFAKKEGYIKGKRTKIQTGVKVQ